MRRLPHFIRNRMEPDGDLSIIIDNIGWLFFDKLLRMGVGVFVGVWVARYLGPSQFGTLNYVIALVALFSTFANLGLDSLVIRDIVRDPSCKEETLGTAFTLKLVGGGLALLFSVGAIFWLRPEETQVRLMVAIIAVGAIFQAFDVIEYWYQSQVQAKYTVYARNAAFLIIALAKVVLIQAGAPLSAFAWAGLGEIALGAWGLLLVYHFNSHSIRAWRYCRSRALQLLRQAWPLFLSGVFVTLYIRIDQIMLSIMLGDRDVGIYSAAGRLSEVWYFVPMAITASVFPAIISAKKAGEVLYYKRLAQLYLVMVWLSLAVAVPVTFFAEPLVQFIFGPEYLNSASVLVIQCWSGLFIFSGLVSNHWYLIEDLNHYTLYRHVLGAIINVLLNLALIPKYGINGAAVATLITQFLSSYLFDLINKPTRVLFKMKSRSFFLFLPTTFKHCVKLLLSWKNAC